MKLILASGSPRRKEILASAGVHFSVLVSDADETLPEGISATEAVALLASRKAHAVAPLTEGAYILAADTVVEAYGSILGKPKDRADALRMLTLLSGSGHAVHTGFSIISPDGTEFTATETTYVTFDELSPEELSEYLDSGEPYDKAGAYAIQGLASRYICGITGDYFNVVGLPLHAVYAAFRDAFGVNMAEFGC